MRFILLDESVPNGLAELFVEAASRVHYAPDLGLAGVSDGQMLEAAVVPEVNIFVTCDQNLSSQQNRSKLTFGVVVTCTNNWSTISRNNHAVMSACRQAGPGKVLHVLADTHLTRYGRHPKAPDPS